MSFLKSLFGSGSNASDEGNKKKNAEKNFDSLKYDGVRALRSGHMDAAISLLTAAIDINDDLECHDYLSQAYTHSDRLPEALEQLRLLCQAQPDNTAILARIADVAYMAEDYDTMAEACEKAMALDKDNPAMLFSYARACRGKGDIINAIALLTKAIALKPDYGAARLLRGEVLLKMGDANSASADADALLVQHADNEDVLMLAARVAEAKGLHDKAIETYGKVIDVNPFCIEAFRERGAIKLASGDTKGAEDDMRSVLELDPKATEGISGDYSAEGVEHKVQNAYRSIDPYGIFNK